MIEFDDPRLPEQDLVLLPDEALRGGEPDTGQGPDAPPPLRGRVRLGGPLAQRLTPEQLAGDPGLSEYLTGQADTYDYYLVHLSLTFAPTPSGPGSNSPTSPWTSPPSPRLRHRWPIPWTPCA
ncbi:hypothetical protein AB6O49_18045 [Streptomyces sp. SBR177]